MMSDHDKTPILFPPWDFSSDGISVMRRIDLTDLSAFVAVAENRSFRAAAQQLGVTPSALSHRLRQLEQRIGVRLLHRTTRSVAATDAGRRLLEQLRPAFDQIIGAFQNLEQDRNEPAGKLTIHAPVMTVEMVVAPVWRAFLERYPKVELEVSRREDVLDIVEAGFDAGISIQELVALDMTGVRVAANMKVVVVGAPSYFARHPRPQKPEDLKHHNCIQLRLPMGGTLLSWTFARERTARALLAKADQVPVNGNLIVDNLEIGLRAAVDGIGLYYTVENSADFLIRSGHLVSVLEDWTPSFDGFYLYYPGKRQIPAALRALIDMIKANYKEGGRTVADNPLGPHSMQEISPSLAKKEPHNTSGKKPQVSVRKKRAD
jgi:DNA-binding transcriptional LysR family regulator